ATRLPVHGPAVVRVDEAQRVEPVALTCPGVPALHQGDEPDSLSLVDPGNRRPVASPPRRRPPAPPPPQLRPLRAAPPPAPLRPSARFDPPPGWRELVPGLYERA